jgi:ArsR family transcriptional regulator
VVLAHPGQEERWQLYKLLSDPLRLRLLALAAEEELAVGELAQLLGEAQPNVSRHAAPLRQAGLLSDRRQGTRTLIRLADSAAGDAVVADALGAGKELCTEDGSLARVREVIRGRDARTREFFSRPGKPKEPPPLAKELPAYLSAMSRLVSRRSLALDAGTGDGTLLDLLAPLFERVVALDRSEAQLGRALFRIRARGYENVELVCGEVDGPEVRCAVGEGADAVVALRMLHHAPLPRDTLASLASLLRSGGQLFVIDYCRHDDPNLEEQADVWMGFEPEELEAYASAAALVDIRVVPLAPGLLQGAPDAHVGWQVLAARRPEESSVGVRLERKRR